MATQWQEKMTTDEYFSVNQWQNGAVAAMTNHSFSTLSLDRFRNWAGIPSTGSFPSTIPPNDSAHFTHLRSGQFGSSAGVQYSGYNATGVPCAWIFAWQAPVESCLPSHPNRVYVACGQKTKMDAMTWEQILQRLDNSPTDDYDSNSATKTSADAHIHDRTPDLATLVANFRLT
ncbi:hypothetical protein vseg_014800 [Gypsophila vaccaria]